MKQVFQDISSGETKLEDVPWPRLREGHLQLQTTCSLISAGTERMLVEFGRSNMINKARQQPDKVRMVFDKVRADGLLPTIEAVKSQLASLLPLGYCNVGVVSQLSHGVSGFNLGDRVVSNGSHADVVCVPKNLCARIPESVSDEDAVFTVLAAVGLQGIRLAKPTIGESIVVVGLGLIGLLTVQMLRAHGCRVLGIDFDESRLALAEKFGADTVNLGNDEDPISVAMRFSRGRGVDAVLITASSKSDEPVHQAATMCRKRGRIILVGVTGLNLSRADFYEKELSFQVSCSYGPGRYDSEYEDGGHDYPVGYVRWTEQRNFEAVLDLMASGALDIAPLISHRFPIDEAEQAYQLLISDKSVKGIVLEYGDEIDASVPDTQSTVVQLSQDHAEHEELAMGVIGAGNYAGRTLLPAFKKARVDFRTMVSNGGVSAVQLGKKFGFSQIATEPTVIFEDEHVTAVIVATRHNSHAEYVLRAAESGKHIFVEKPLCLSLEDLDRIKQSIQSSQVQLMVGFNRRFSPLVVHTKKLLAQVPDPKAFIMTVNAGYIPKEHWVHDPASGGGRIVGECCHFIDLLRHLSGAAIKKYSISIVDDRSSASATSDNAVINLSFEDGSIGTIHYLANGHRGFPKERLEVFASGRILRLDNFKKLQGWGWKGFSSRTLWRQNKGQEACVDAFISGISDGTGSPINLDEIMEVSKISIELERMAK